MNKTHGSTGLPCGSVGKESAHNAGDLGSIPGLGRSPGEGKGYPLQYSGLENFMDCIVRGVAESDTTGQLHSHGSTHCHMSVGGYRQARIIPCFSELSEEYSVLIKLLIN